MTDNTAAYKPVPEPETEPRSGGYPTPAKRLTAKDFDCPVCGAPQGEPCRGSAYSGRSQRNVQSHHARVQLAKEATR